MGTRAQRRKVADRMRRLMDTELLRALGEPVRIDLLATLAVEGPADIQQIAKHFSQDRSVISRHLRQLAQAGILIRQRRSRHVIYSINGTILLDKLEAMAEQARSLIRECCPPSPVSD